MSKVTKEEEKSIKKLLKSHPITNDWYIKQ